MNLDREMAALVERDYQRGRVGFSLAEDEEIVERKQLKAKDMDALLKNFKRGKGGYIHNVKNPNWGDFQVVKRTDHDGSYWYDIRGKRGERVLHPGELGAWAISEMEVEISPLKLRLLEGILDDRLWDMTEEELLEKFKVPTPAEVRARSFIPKGVETFSHKTPVGLYIVSWEHHGNLYAIAFSGMRKKPDWYYNFGAVYAKGGGAVTTPSRWMRKRIHDTIKSFKASQKHKAETAAEKSSFEHKYEVGDILYSSWGYDQTNVDFYEVVKVTKKSIKVVKIAQKVTSAGRGSDSVMAVKGKHIGKPTGMKRVRPARDGRGSIKIASYANAYHWDGRPKHQTAAGYGH